MCVAPRAAQHHIHVVFENSDISCGTKDRAVTAAIVELRQGAQWPLCCAAGGQL